jgi:hypothetical protein
MSPLLVISLALIIPFYFLYILLDKVLEDLQQSIVAKKIQF